MMTDKPGFDADRAHKFFAAHCFNAAWQLIDKSDRTADDNEQMIRLAQASLWHWTQRPDCTDKNLSIGYWQSSRVYALVGEAENARKYAQLCLDKTPRDEPFYLGYAYEALARAAAMAGERDQVKQYLAEARQNAARVTDEEERQVLSGDLKTLE
jgi:hypothetical protein